MLHNLTYARSPQRIETFLCLFQALLKKHEALWSDVVAHKTVINGLKDQAGACKVGEEQYPYSMVSCFRVSMIFWQLSWYKCLL